MFCEVPLLSTVRMIEYDEASDEVRSIYDDIMATRQTDWVNNFWKILASRPDLLKDTWADVKSVMSAGELDPLTKEMVYVAVSAVNACDYCINSHTAAARSKGMSEGMLMELMAVVSMANRTNALANGLQIDVDDAFRDGGLMTIDI